MTGADNEEKDQQSSRAMAIEVKRMYKTFV